jgi:hypothetical protein
MDDPLFITALRHEHRDDEETLEFGKLIASTDFGVGVGSGHAAVLRISWRGTRPE